MSNLLINEHPLMVLPSLATKIGLNEAIVIQQVHYWLNMSAKVIDGRKWTYNTYQEWQKQFPFWSERTIRRVIKNLEDEGYLISSNYNKASYDKTKWYSIDYDKLIKKSATNPEVPSCGQNDQTMRTDCPDGCGQNDQMDADKVDRPIPETSTKTNTKTSTNNNIVQQVELCIPFEEIINYLNEQAGTKFRHATKTNQSFIKARWNEGFNSIEDYKTVIDNKVADWINTEHDKYLRPSTLFGTKFESYLNQKTKKKKKRVNDPNDFGAEALEQNFNNENKWGF